MPRLCAKELDKICERQLFSLPYFRAMLRACEQRFYEELNILEPILDIGAGDGHFAEAFLKPKQMIGLDPWWPPLQEAKQRKVYPLLTLAKGDQIPFEEASFPSAISNSVLEHIPDLDTVLKDVYRALEPGGKFYFTVPNERFIDQLWGIKILRKIGLSALAKPYSIFFNKVCRHVNLDSPEVWEERLKRAGFKEVTHWNYFPVGAMQMLERGHLFGIMTLFYKKTIGRWIIFPSRRNPFIPFKKVRQLVENPLSDEGTETFFIATK